MAYGDNCSIVEGWWKISSTNKPTNQVFQHILKLLEAYNRVVYIKYVLSTQNPADALSRGQYLPCDLLLGYITIPPEVWPFLIDI